MVPSGARLVEPGTVVEAAVDPGRGSAPPGPPQTFDAEVAEILWRPEGRRLHPANMVGVRDEAIELFSKVLGWALLLATFGPLMFLIVRSAVAGRPEYD